MLRFVGEDVMAKYRLGDIAPVKQGTVPDNKQYWLLNLDVVESNTGTIMEYLYVDHSQIGASTVSFDQKNVLYSKLRPYLNKVVLPDRAGYATSEMLPLRPDEKIITREYLTFFLRSSHFVEYINGKTSGAKMPRVNTADLKAVEIECPPIIEQNRIVSQINAVLTIIAYRKKELSRLDDLIKARFVEMFGDFKTNSMGWPVVGFEEIATIDGNMTTDYEKYADYPHIGIDSIEKETGLLKGYRTVAEDGVISGKYYFTPSHIIYSKIRPNLNKVALPEFEGLCSADAYPILPIEGKCNRVFLAYDMRSSFFLDYILQFCNRTNLPKVNRKEVSGFKTPLPPMDLQNEFARFVAQVDKSKAVIQKSLDEAQLLFDSLMQQYFG